MKYVKKAILYKFKTGTMKGREFWITVHDKDNICSAFVLNLSWQILSLTHLSVFWAGQIMIFNLDLHHICPHLHPEANAQLSYLSLGQMSYLSSNQIPTNVTNIIFEPHLDCICLMSNLFFRPVSFRENRIWPLYVLHEKISRVSKR